MRTSVGRRLGRKQLAVADVVEDIRMYKDVLTLVDTCGYETRGLWSACAIEMIIPNVFTPDASGKNDNFRIRGLDGYGVTPDDLQPLRHHGLPGRNRNATRNLNWCGTATSPTATPPLQACTSGCCSGQTDSKTAAS